MNSILEKVEFRRELHTLDKRVRELEYLVGLLVIASVGLWTFVGVYFLFQALS